MDEFLSSMFTTQWRVVLFVAVLLLSFAEFGYRLGGRLKRPQEEGRRAQVAGIQGALLGLLGLLLGFTFAMAVQRYDARRTLVVQEANAIGTAYLRAALLAEPHGDAVRDLLRGYVDVRLVYGLAGRDQARSDAALRQSATAHEALWALCVAAAQDTPAPLLASFMAPLNELIDLVASRTAAARNHVPGAVWLLLLIVAASGCCASGYGGGAHGRRFGFAQFVVPVLIAVVVTILVDFDSPRHGLIGTSQQSMLDLKASIAPPQRNDDTTPARP